MPAHAWDMDTKRKRKPNAHRVRRHAIPSALVVGGVGLAAAGVPVGIGWGLVLAGVALGFQPFSGSTSDRSDQVGSASAQATRASPAAGLSGRRRGCDDSHPSTLADPSPIA